jgi:hypothetical protein
LGGVIAFDCETEPFRPGLQAPPIACVQWQSPGCAPDLGTERERLGAGPWSGLAAWAGWALDQALTHGTILVGHHVAYDLGCFAALEPRLLPLIFRAYQESRITDTAIRQKLADIGRGLYRLKGGYNLEDVARRHGAAKRLDDPWRTRYAELRDVPLAQWPREAVEYALGDPSATLAAYLGQMRYGPALLCDEFAQARKFWGLHLAHVWGCRTSKTGVDQLERATIAERDRLGEILREQGLVRADGSRDTKAAAARMVAAVPDYRKTKGGGVCLDSDACEESGDPLLESYAEYSSLAKVISNDVAMLAGGVTHPIHTRWDMAATTRVTSSKPNIQNPRRLPGVRECFVPREGRIFASADFDGLELRCMAQVCVTLLGRSELARVLNAGADPHLMMAGNMLGVSYDQAVARASEEKRARAEARAWARAKFGDETAAAQLVPTPVDDARQAGKVANFGFPGGLGFEKLILFARKTYGVRLDEPKARWLKGVWLQTFPEFRLYFDMVRSWQDGSKLVTFRHLNGMIRGGARYTAACNSLFQQLGAVATGEALFDLQRAAYAEPASPLFGARLDNYVHDDYIYEVLESSGHESATELVRIMCAAARRHLPDVPPSAKPQLMRYWSKDAKPVKVAGRLVPWPDKGD